MTPDERAEAQQLVDRLQALFGVKLKQGQLSLNINEGAFSTYEVHMFVRLEGQRRLDNGDRRSAPLTR